MLEYKELLHEITADRILQEQKLTIATNALKKIQTITTSDRIRMYAKTTLEILESLDA